MERFLQTKHLIQIDDLSRTEIEKIFALAEYYLQKNRNKVEQKHPLKPFTQINVFFENSTRTLASFELAGKKLGGLVQDIRIATSSVQKGETLIDTALTLNAMRPDLLVVRHSSSGAVNLLSEKVNCSVLNAGDGSHEHPTQALLDFLTIQYRKKKKEGLVIAICGDINHSRVALSNIALLCRFNNHVRLIGPSNLLPNSFKDMGLEIYNHMEDGVRDADVIMMLRLQKERMKGGFIPSRREYFNRFGLDHQKLSLAKNDAIVMHPGPVNYVEISESVYQSEQSVIRNQIANGVAIRMAVLSRFLSS